MPTWLLAMLALVGHGCSHAALPPPAATLPPPSPSPVANTEAKEVAESPGFSWRIPSIQIGGTLQYSLRREYSDEQQNSQNGLTATIRARTATYIWQPWLATVSGDLSFTSSTDRASGTSLFNDNEVNSSSSSSRNVVTTGGARLSVFPYSKFPFEAYYQKNDSRVSSDLAIANSFAGQRYGFTQRYGRPAGDASLSWERSTQSSAENGRDQQDRLELRMTHRMERLNIEFNTDHNTNSRKEGSESITQTNLSVNDNYQPDPTLSVQSQANLSNGTYSLVQGGTTTRVMQLSSTAFWRPEEKPYTVNGGVRVFALGVNGSGQGNAGEGFDVTNQNINVNAGISYEFSRFTRFNASGNLNMMDSNGEKRTSTNQSANISYQPESIELGKFRYNWGTSANASNQTGGEESQQQLSLQLSHSLSRSITLGSGSSLSLDANQSLSASASTGADGTGSKRMTHGASVSLNTSGESISSLLRLSLNDSRALDGDRDFFQLINFQASSNLPTSSYSSWSGNLTIQAIRQSNGMNAGTSNLAGSQSSEQDNGFVTTSSGSISYQNQRMFGIRQLRFNSDLRLNGEFVLPLFGDSQDQEAAAWENQLSYFIGRTQLRLNFQVTSTSTPKTTIDPVTKAENVEKVKKVNKSIAFTLQRNFGAY